jgi:hypothetical protein
MKPTTADTSFETLITQSVFSDTKEDTMSTPTIARTISARWLHSSIVIGSTLVIVAAIAVVLMLRSPSGTSPAAHTIPAAVDSSTLLDQHERHPAATTDVSCDGPKGEEVCTDQHERHPAATTERDMPLKKHVGMGGP